MSNNETIALCDSSTDSIIIDDSVGDDESVEVLEDDMFFMDTSQCQEQHSALMDESISDMSGVVSHIFTPENKPNERRRKNLCFNCGGEHTLAACKEKKDMRRINKNRDAFLGPRGANKTTRLHEQQSSSNFQPGFISDELRDALGIRGDELPEWIFRMRKRGFIHGYPPAYLKRAIEKNVLSFFTNDEDAEDGDLVLDRSKVYAYPGFNKYVRGLRDPERFKIPSWDEFIRIHEEELSQRNSRKTSKESRKRLSTEDGSQQSAKRKRKSAADRLIEDGEIIDDESLLDSSECFGSDVDDRKAYISLEQTQSSIKVDTVTKGTMIMLSRSISTTEFDHEVKKPDLENFSKDIVPFEHRNVTSDSGFFSKILDLVKGLKQKKT